MSHDEGRKAMKVGEFEEMIMMALRMATRCGLVLRIYPGGEFSVTDPETSHSFIERASIEEVVAFLAGACISKGIDPREVV